MVIVRRFPGGAAVGIGSGIRLYLSPLSCAGAVQQLTETGRLTLPNVIYTVEPTTSDASKM